jgi:L-threonylcarbamoyladenylate synthase
LSIVVKISPISPESELIDKAARLIQAGSVIVFPTDTLYGMGANALNPSATLRIFEIKGRPPGMPLPVAVDNVKMAEKLAVIGADGKRLIESFWPGALTLVFPKKEVVPDIVTGGTKNIALRAPNHLIPMLIVKRSKLPIIITSANRHGEQDCRDAEEVMKQLGNSVDLVLDGGKAQQSASTVLDLTNGLRILREGPITREMLQEVLGFKVG